ncbi:MAG TPA: type IV pilus assembly protein PilM [Candidatus Saccharimonadales bacterium]|nr:type IV pilus assembly protein PilM [Candidatus Saccharimonadales bacterium]
MGTIHTPNLLRTRPLFGLDVGHGSLKVMQVDTPAGTGRMPTIIGYGIADFDSAALDNGVIVKPELIADALLKLFQRNLIGDITTRRVAVAIPSYRSFSRSMQLPKLSTKDLREAVRLEAEQYIPVPLDGLYLDYMITHEDKETNDLLAVAVPKEIVDSYLTLARMVGLEVMLVETTMAADSRLFGRDRFGDVTSVIIDFGSLTADISIFNRTTLVTGTVPAGGLVFTNNIKDSLGVTLAEAGVIKTKYGLSVSKRQAEIVKALEPTLQQLVKEIRRMIRYHDEHYETEAPIGQVIMLGGGANMPGMSEYLTNALRLPVRVHDPWQYLQYDGLQTPNKADSLMYATVAGLSLANPKEIFA